MTSESHRPRTRSLDIDASKKVNDKDEKRKKDMSPVKEKKEKKEKKSKKEKSERKSESSSKSAEKHKRKRDEEDDQVADVSIDEDRPAKVSKASKKDDVSVTLKKNETGTESKLITFPLDSFDLCQKSLNALAKRGISSLFEIQARTFPIIMKGLDVIGRAHTGCGKTLAFTLPLIEQIEKRGLDTRRGRGPVVLIMAPTRELARQVSKEFSTTGPHLATCTVYGGAPIQQQAREMYVGLDCVVGTPGRICDHIERGNLKLGRVCHLVLDEADQMLDMGFKDEMQKVFDAILDHRTQENQQTPLQTLLFSATLPKWVNEIARSKMKNPTTVDLVGEEDQKASSNVEHMSLQCPWQTRGKVISDLVRVYGNLANNGRTIIFCSTKKMCNELAVDKDLSHDAKVLHGDIAQGQRETTLSGFASGKFPLLIATDVAARGLDIKGVDLVIQVEPPCGSFSGRAEIETYVHRSGRTGRAGRSGYCVTLYKYNQVELIREIERGTGNTLRRIGSPQPIDILKAAAKDACSEFHTFDEDLLEHLQPLADELIEKMGARNALAAALAKLAGFSDSASLAPRSLLQGAEDYVSVHFSSNGVELNALGYVFNALRRIFPPEVVESARGMTLTADRLGAVMDLDVKYMDEIKKVCAAPRSTLSLITDLPELQDKPSSNGGGDRFGGNRGGGRGFSRDGGRNGGGGYGRGGGGSRGGRGRGRW